MNEQRLLERFLRYVQVDTTAREGAAAYPSSPGQIALGRIVADELRQAGIEEVVHDEHGIVMATVPATVEGDPPVIAFCAHLDTSPETSGAGVKPQVIANYGGGDLPLPGDPSRVIRVAENPEMATLIGRTLITSDGTTLLGADDKAGVAVIMESAAWLAEHPEIRHGRVRICFTCDEEIGHGVEHLDPGRLGAAVCYTLDGQGSQHHRRGDVLRRPGRGDHPRREHPSLDRQGANDQRPASRGQFPPASPPLDPFPGNHRGSAGLPAPLRDPRRSGSGGDRHPACAISRPPGSPSCQGCCSRRPPRRCSTSRPPKSRSTRPGSTATWPKGLPASRGPSPMPSRPCSGWAARRS